MELQIIRSKRKTLSLQVIDKNHLRVLAPLRLGEHKILEFVSSKQAWIAKNLAKMDEKEALKGKFDFENYVYILGEKHLLSEFGLAFEKPKTSGSVLVYDEIYKDYAKNYLPKRAEEISKSIGLGYKQLKISRSKRYWGSYSKSGIMHLNYKMMFLPPEIVDYVIIHELCHSKHFNHSPAFWSLVKTYYPNYKGAKQQLDRFGFLLDEE